MLSYYGIGFGWIGLIGLNRIVLKLICLVNSKDKKKKKNKSNNSTEELGSVRYLDKTSSRDCLM